MFSIHGLVILVLIRINSETMKPLNMWHGSLDMESVLRKACACTEHIITQMTGTYVHSLSSFEPAILVFEWLRKPILVP
jgi:hypothetical protein